MPKHDPTDHKYLGGVLVQLRADLKLLDYRRSTLKAVIAALQRLINADVNGAP